MANWYNIVIPIAAVVLGFFLGILRQKLFEKKVSLSHKPDTPAVFSVIPPKISFQNLKIANKGKLPAKNLRINLDADIIKRHDAIYKPITEEQYKEETREGILTLKFDMLLPEEELTISFKSSEPIPEDFLVNIKSDEMLSKYESEQKSRYPEILQFIVIVVALASVGLSIGFFASKQASQTPKIPSKLAEQPALSLTIMKDKSIYGKGQNAEITYQIRNLKKDILRDIWGKLEIPGFELNNDQKYMAKKWLEGEGQITYRVAFSIPKDVPSGKHKIILEVSKGGTGQSLYPAILVTWGRF
jgi:hypothetical protein